MPASLASCPGRKPNAGGKFKTMVTLNNLCTYHSACGIVILGISAGVSLASGRDVPVVDAHQDDWLVDCNGTFHDDLAKDTAYVVSASRSSKVLSPTKHLLPKGMTLECSFGEPLFRTSNVSWYSTYGKPLQSMMRSDTPRSHRKNSQQQPGDLLQALCLWGHKHSR